jgi:uncharacterized RDD family membrane protein YckC
VKCPKCGYLGFESGDRCRNCGYDFSLISQPGGQQARTTPLRAGTPADLPLFRGEAPILPPPRAPLAVRRSTPTPARIRQRPPTPQPVSTPLLAVEPGPQVPARAAQEVRLSEPAGGEREWDVATAGRRAAAAAIDLGLLALVDLVVLHFTLALCGLTFNDLHVLPVLPLAAFLLLLNGGYVVLFTGTLGQTFGKMAAEIEVVSDGRDRMDLRRALVRGAALLPSLLPAGLGWLAGLVGDHRSLHDRLAGTRVVRVPGA